MKSFVFVTSTIFICMFLVSCLDEKAGKKHSGSEIRTVSGRVVAVADGDTLTILDTHKAQHKIRLAGIDTPEKSQSFGKRAKNELSKKVFGKTVNIEIIDIDRYQRMIGNVFLKNRWINREMVQEGWAWHYKTYSKSSALAEAEKQARSAKRGLWREKDPIAPWEFRRKARERK